MTAEVAETFVAAVPWADAEHASPLLDLRTASGRRYDASGRALMSPRTLRLLQGNMNPADLWGRRHGTGETFAGLFRNDVLPVPWADDEVPDGRVVFAQDGLPPLTLYVGG
jgi:hypothetical protein